MTNEKIYHLDVELIGDENTAGTAIANAFGDLDIVAYVARKAEKLIKDAAGDAALTLVEVSAIGGGTVRTVATLTADADTVGLVLRKRLASERKAGRPVDTTTADTTVQEPAPTTDTQHTDGVPVETVPVEDAKDHTQL